MNKSNYYDNIAPIYDQTRWLTNAIAEEIADFILKLVAATPETSFLEPGVGTGLNVLPLIKRGYSVTGVDISAQMLAQLRQKLPSIPANLTLIHGDSSQLPFADNSFDVVLTVHMLHVVADGSIFLDEVYRVLKPGGFYLNSQWITPPARKAFENLVIKIISKYESEPQSKRLDNLNEKIDVEDYFNQRGITSNYFIAKEWTVSNTISELISCFRSKAYGLCWRVPDEIFNQVMTELATFCISHYGSLEKVLSSDAKFEIWAYSIVK